MSSRYVPQWKKRGECEKQDALHDQYDADLSRATQSNDDEDWAFFFRKSYRCDCDNCKARHVLEVLEG